MTITLDNNSLLKYLNEKDLKPAFQKETNQCFINIDIQGIQVSLFFLIRPESHLLQMVAYLPYKIPKKNYGEVARLLHILNQQLDLPGFGMDESEGLMFYRSAIPCLENTFEEKILDMHIGVTRLACDTFMHVIAAVASGTASVDEVFKRKKE